MEDLKILLRATGEFLAKIILFLIKAPFLFLNALFDTNKYLETTQKVKRNETQDSIELIGEPHEKVHFELAQEGEFMKQSLIQEQEKEMYFALINPSNRINTKRYAICPQASLGELFNVVGYKEDKAKNQKYRKTFNSKRADIAIVDKDEGFIPVSLIEIIGVNHDLRGVQKSRYRDETVKLICQKSGVRYHEFFENDNCNFDSWIESNLDYLKVKH
jgi:hypothetical protein